MIRPLPALLLCVCALASPALADVDVAVGNGDKVSGTLAPATEVETFRVALPQGARLTVTVKGLKPRGGSAPVATFRILRPDGSEAAPFQPTRGTGAKLAGFVAATSGEHAIEVKGDGVTSGDYALTVTWTSPRKFTLSGDLTAGSFDAPIDVDDGARATFTVAAARGSPAHPKFERVRDAGASFDLPFAAPATGARSHKVKNVLLPGGRLSVTVSDTDASGGAVTGSVAVKPPAPGRRSVVVTDAKIGDAAGGRSAFGELIGAEGGILSVGGTLTGIDGASVSVPAGALPFPTAFVVATSATVAAGTGLAAAGPAVFFGPENLKFPADKRALVTIPFNPALARGDASAVRVFVRDAKGKVAEVASEPPYPIVDLVNGSVTFPAAHFSSYQAFVAPKGVVADLNGDDKADLVLPAPAAAGGIGRIYVFLGGATLASTTTSLAELTLEGTGGVGDDFGRAHVVADLNDDGTEDLAVSARQPPRVMIWFGGPTFFVAGPPDVTIAGEATDPNFGISLAAANVHGIPAVDLVVGDESNTRKGTTTGAAFVFRGPITADRTASQFAFLVQGEATGDLFGASVATGDLVGDGRADLVVGADQADNAGTGKVYVFAGSVGPGTADASAATVILAGENADDGFGLHLAVADVDGGGRSDLVVSAPGFDLDATRLAAGKVYVYRAESDLTGAGATPQVTVVGSAADDATGEGLAAADVTGDGKAEVLIGAPGTDVPSNLAGSVGVLDVFANRTFGTLPRILGPSTTSVFGQRVSAPLDLNGDGRLDLVIAAPGNQGGGNQAGRVFVFFGRTAPFTGVLGASSADLNFTGAAGERLGGK